MPFNKEINGFQNEDEFVKYLNNKTINNLNPIFQDLIFDLYGNISEKEIIKCQLNPNKQKADILLNIANIQKGISIKKGVKNSVHIEPVNQFINFLIECKIPKNIINEVLLYHYGDGTIDGSGKERISSTEYKLNNQKKLDLINKYFNEKEILIKAVDRFVLTGNNSEKPIDAIIYGVIDDFIWINKNEIIDIILSNRHRERTGLAFGSLFYQPMNRCLNYNPKYEYARNYIQIKWYHLSDDIIEVMANRTQNAHY